MPAPRLVRTVSVVSRVGTFCYSLTPYFSSSGSGEVIVSIPRGGTEPKVVSRHFRLLTVGMAAFALYACVSAPLIASAFRIDPDRPGVILPPVGDLIWIRPLRLNSDEYLILQKCIDADCSKAQVVRAWNAYGYMGPYPVLTNKVWAEPGVRYLLWMQRVPTSGTGSFRLYQRDAPPLVFKPAGSPELFSRTDLKAAQEHGPARIKKAQPEGATFVVTFEGGSVVRMQAFLTAPPAGSIDGPRT